MINNEKEIITAIEQLVAIPSVLDEESIGENAPFGLPIKQAMDEFMKIAKAWGFRVKDVDGYACYAEIGPESQDYIGVLGHLDIVDAGDVSLWESNPYQLDIRDGVMYGRGVNDDKGPLIGALYAAKIVAEKLPNMKYPIRVIAGGAEETTWECIDYYFNHYPQPVMGFSPDGNFPIVNGEMGLVQVRLKLKGIAGYKLDSEVQTIYNCDKLSVNGADYKSGKVLSRNPQRSDHAYEKFIDERDVSDSLALTFLKETLAFDYSGRKLGVFKDHTSMNNTSVCVMSLNTVDDYLLCDLDIRFPKSTTLEKIISQVQAHSVVTSLEIIKARDPHFVDENHVLIQSLKQAYSSIMNEEAVCITKGGASYARVMDHGVAFGATFEGEDPRPHMPNENMGVESLMKAIEIYISSLEIMCS